MARIISRQRHIRDVCLSVSVSGHKVSVRVTVTMTSGYVRIFIIDTLTSTVPVVYVVCGVPCRVAQRFVALVAVDLYDSAAAWSGRT